MGGIGVELDLERAEELYRQAYDKAHAAGEIVPAAVALFFLKGKMMLRTLLVTLGLATNLTKPDGTTGTTSESPLHLVGEEIPGEVIVPDTASDAHATSESDSLRKTQEDARFQMKGFLLENWDTIALCVLVLLLTWVRRLRVRLQIRLVREAQAGLHNYHRVEEQQEQLRGDHPSTNLPSWTPASNPPDASPPME